MHKERVKANEVESVIVIGDVKGKTCILVDDMVDTAGTLCMAADELKQKGAEKVYAFITHGIFSNPAAERISKSVIDKVVCTYSMKIDDLSEKKMADKLVRVSIDLLLAEVIRRAAVGE